MSNGERKRLVLTAIDASCVNDDDVVLALGEWCGIYGQVNKDQKGDVNNVLPYHWDDREKLARDYAYLKALHDRLLSVLAVQLNDAHCVNRPDRYWQAILDPWLLTYVAVLYDRWELLRTAFDYSSNYRVVSFDDIRGEWPPLDYNKFISSVSADKLNHTLFCDILRYEYKSSCRFDQVHDVCVADFVLPISGFDSGAAGGVKEVVRRLFDKVCSFQKKNSVFFYQSYMSDPFRFAFLNACLRQVPCYSCSDFDRGAIRSNVDPYVRASLHLDGFGVMNAFEGYLASRVFDDIPIAYLEGYGQLLRESSSIKRDPKVIVTGVAHWGNELFKLWSAEKVEKGCKLVVVRHGGSINIEAKIAMGFEEAVSDYYVTPSRFPHEKHVRLPFPKKIPRKSVNRSWCSMLGFEQPRYAIRAGDTPIAGQVLSCYEQTVGFFLQLSGEIRDVFRVRPYADLGWNTRQRYIDDIGRKYVASDGDYSQYLANSKLIICTYPNTTLSEAMGSGIPTILLFKKNLWELHDWVKPLLESLISAKIVFSDETQAATHLNNIWSDVDGWWSDPLVVSARNAFEEYAVHFGRHTWVKEWYSFLSNIIH